MIRVIEFKTEYRTNKDPIDLVLIAPSGPGFERTRTWHRVKDLRPPEDWDDSKQQSLTYRVMIERWGVIGPAYEAWKQGSEMPETGTPLEAWSGVTAEQAKFLKAMGVRTVEDVRDMNDAALGQLRFPHARKLPGLAADYLAGADIVAKDAEIAEMRERMAAMEAMLEETTKPKRGRPAKVKDEGEAA